MAYAVRMGKGEEFAALVRDGRKARGLTQFELANAVGLRQTISISRWENGHTIPDPPVCEKVIHALGLDPDQVWPLWGLAYAERVREGLSELKG